MAINTTSFSNTPQATNDAWYLTEDNYVLLQPYIFDVMLNDLGGNAKSLYSIDNGVEDDGTSGADLLIKEAVGVADHSLHNASIKITADGKVSYDASTFSAEFKAQIQALAPGQELVDSFTYAIRLGNGTLSWATVSVRIAGLNDAPVVSGVVSGTAVEDGAMASLDALAKASDVDSGTVLAVVNVPSQLPAGVSYNAATHTFTLDPGNAEYQHLAHGQTTDVCVNYGVSDGSVTTAGSVKFTVTGTNDAPTITSAVTGNATEGGAAINGQVSATDVDDGASLTYSVTDLGPLPAGLTFEANGNYSFDPTVDAYNHLKAGAKQDVVVHFKANDGTADSNIQTLTITVTGTNDAPIAAVKADAATEGGAAINGQVSATDVDDGASLTYSVTDLGPLPAGLTFEANGNYSFDPTVDAYNHLKAGAKQDVVVHFKANDGTADSNIQTLTITVTGTNDAPVVTSDSTGTVLENAALSAVVYDASATDADDSDILAYALSGADKNAFNINVTTGEVRLNASANFEAKSTYHIDVIATDSGSLTSTKAVTIGVTDVNEAPTAVLLSNVLNAIDENTSTVAHIKVADVAVSDDALGTEVFSLTGADAASFELVGSALYLKAGIALDFEAKASYAVNVDVDDASVGGNPDASQTFLLNVNNLAEGVAATDLRLVVDAIPSGNGLPTGAFAHLAVVDTDGGGAHSYTMTTTINGTTSNALTVDGATGVVSTSGLSDGTVYALAVQTTQAGASAYSETLYITTGTNKDNNLSGSGDDVIYAMNGTDLVLAGSGDDTVFGQGGDDTLKGEAGNDILYGGGGINQLTGGTGSDTFVFDSNGINTVLDFHGTPTATEVDMVLLSGFNNIANDASGHLNSSYFASLASGGDSATVASDQNIIFDRTTGNLYYDSNGGSNASRSLIGHIDVIDGSASTFDFNDIKVGT